MKRKHAPSDRADPTRRSVVLGAAALAASLLPQAGHALLITAEGTAPTSSPSGGGASPKLLEGKTVLITASTQGLGKAVAMKLAQMGAVVLVHGRNKIRGNAVVEAIKDKTNGCAKFYRADLASLTDVRKMAEAVRQDNKRIDLLINNANISGANIPGLTGRELSADGYELRFAVNYLSGYVLTRELLPVLESSAPARIINIASLAQTPLDFSNVMLERGYDLDRAYSQSKLAQVMFTQDLAQELADKNVTANSVHPATHVDIYRSTVEEAAAAVVYVATAPELKGKSGLFFNGRREVKANAQAYDAAARAKLRALSEKLVKA